MRRCIVTLLILLFNLQLFAQGYKEIENNKLLLLLKNDKNYQSAKSKVLSDPSLNISKHGVHREIIPNALDTRLPLIALTFDACGTEQGKGFDQEIINYLKSQSIPATLFVSGKWIDKHTETFSSLCKDTLFEIENHGLKHDPCSSHGDCEYGICGTSTLSEAYDEIEGNARKIESFTGKRPRYYRSGTAFVDETAVRMATLMGITIVNWDVSAGDEAPAIPEHFITKSVIKSAKPGSIVLMHINHPEWHTDEALRKIIPALKRDGYRFVHLDQLALSTHQ